MKDRDKSPARSWRPRLVCLALIVGAACKDPTGIPDNRLPVVTAITPATIPLGSAATEVVQGERTFDLVVRLQEPFRRNMDAIKNLLIATPDGQHLPLSQFAAIRVDQEADAQQASRRSGASGSRLKRSSPASTVTEVIVSAYRVRP